MRIDKALQIASQKLGSIAQRPRLEAEILLAHYLQKDRVYLHAHPEAEVDTGYFVLIQRRERYEPIEYITNRVSFYGKKFFIDKGALIPRPETEILIDEISSYLRGDEKVAEIGVGSGVISTILKMKLPDLKITATDISPKALAIARKNFEKFGVEVELVQTNLLDGIEKDFDVIISNPPYIAKDYKLEKNIALYEPNEALFAGERGDEILRQIIELFLQKEATILACEMGYDQKQKIQEFLQQKNFIGEVKFFKDLAGLDRGFVLKKEKNA